MINLIASIIYVLMQFIPVPGWLIIVAQMTWQGGHGKYRILFRPFLPVFKRESYTKTRPLILYTVRECKK